MEIFKRLYKLMVYLRPYRLVYDGLITLYTGFELFRYYL